MLHFLFSFKGRVTRTKFWIFYLVGCLFAGTVAGGIMTAVQFLEKGPGTTPPLPWPFGWSWSPWDILMAAFVGLFFYAVVAVVVKRLHDRGKSAWWLLLFYGLPLASFAALRLTEFLPQTTLQPHWIQTALFVVNSVIIWWYLLEILFLPGNKGDNRFGPDPRDNRKPI